jgi:hypothetical protein
MGPWPRPLKSAISKIGCEFTPHRVSSVFFYQWSEFESFLKEIYGVKIINIISENNILSENTVKNNKNNVENDKNVFMEKMYFKNLEIRFQATSSSKAGIVQYSHLFQCGDRRGCPSDTVLLLLA